ncbi:MAG: MFS transporter [Deltaproteobacteria bacterium]|nr:MFS transporter [Deltaproteobacteria bacterium]
MAARSLEQGLRRNPPLLCAFRALQLSLFPMAVITLFMKHEVGLSMTEIMGLQAIFGFFTAVFEFPSGYLADRVGYRRAMLASSGVAIAGWIAYAAADGFWTIAAAEVLLALALSLVSGTDAALLYESLLETGREDSFGTWYGRFQFFGQAAEGSAALLAGVLYLVWTRLPFLVQIGVWVVAAGVAFALTEPARHRPRVTDPWARVGRIVSYAAVRMPRLRVVIALTVALGTGTFIAVWIVALYAEDAGVPVAWLGPIWAVANYSVALGALASARLSRWMGLLPLLLLSSALIGLGYAGMGLTYAWWGFAFYFCLCVARGLFTPALGHEEQRVIPSSDRASLLSLRALIFRGLFVAIGPAVGLAIDHHGQHPALLTSGAVMVAVSLAGTLWLARTPVPEGVPEQV